MTETAVQSQTPSSDQVETLATPQDLACTAHTGPVVRACPDQATWHQLRAVTIGASESAGLMIADSAEESQGGETDDDEGESVSPYLTSYQLYHLKADTLPAEDREGSSNNRTEYGNLLEPVIAEAIARKQGWSFRKPAGYYLHPQVPGMGASLDYEVDVDGDGRFEPYEIKNVAATEAWKWRNSVGEWIVPPWIEIQCQHQMSVTGCERAVVGVLFGGNEDRVFEVYRDQELIETLEETICAFWDAVEAGEPPEPNYERDAWVIKALNRKIDPDGAQVLDWTGSNELMNAAQELKHHASQMNFHKKEADRLKAQLMHELGGAKAADLGQDLMLSSTEVAGTHVSYYRRPYRKLDVKAPRKRHAGKSVSAAARENGNS